MAGALPLLATTTGPDDALLQPLAVGFVRGSTRSILDSTAAFDSCTDALPHSNCDHSLTLARFLHPLPRCSPRDRDGFLAEAEHMRPINTYYGGNGSGGGSSDGSQHSSVLPQPSSSNSSSGISSLLGGSSSEQPHAPAEYAQQAAMAGILPTQLGSIDGLKAPPQQLRPTAAAAGQWPGGAGAAAGAAAAAAAAAAATGGLSVGERAQMQAHHAVRISPKHPQQDEHSQHQHQQPSHQPPGYSRQQQQEQQEQEQQGSGGSCSGDKDDNDKDPPGSWMDDERYSWD